MAMAISGSTNGEEIISEENVGMQPNETSRHEAPTVKVLVRTEQAKHGLIYEGDVDESLCSVTVLACGMWRLAVCSL
jgi:hypothetical protein